MNAPSPILETSRLTLRPVVDEDAETTAKLVTPDIAIQLSTWVSPMLPQEALDRIRRSQRQLAERKSVDFAILRRAGGNLMGWMGFWRVSEDRARIGYWLGTQFRRQGFATEALVHAIPAARAILGFSTVEALVLPANTASASLLSKIGFVRAGETEEFIEREGRSVSCIRLLLPVIP